MSRASVIIVCVAALLLLAGIGFHLMHGEPVRDDGPPEAIADRVGGARDDPAPADLLRTETDPIVLGLLADRLAPNQDLDTAAITQRLMELAVAEPDLARMREHFSGGGLELEDSDLRLEYRRPFIQALGRSTAPEATRFLIGQFDEEGGHQILVALESHHTNEAFELRRRVALSSGKAGLRKTALATLAGDTAHRGEALQLCARALEGDADLEVRKQALGTLAELGPEAGPIIESALKDPNAHIRQAAQRALEIWTQR